MTENATERNRALVEGMYRAAAGGDPQSVFSLLHPDIVVNEPGFLPYGGTYRGLEEFGSLMQAVLTLCDISGIEVDRIVADGANVIGVFEMPLHTGGRVRLAEESVFDDDGRIVEITVYFHEAGSLVAPAPRIPVGNAVP